MNTVYEQFSKITNQKIEKLKKANQNQLKEFWGSLITIFGIFVTVFSLININVRPIYYSNELHLTGKELLAQSACNVAPLAVVLGVFLVALFFIFRK